MNRNNFPRWITLPLLAMLIIISCDLPTSLTSPVPQTQANIQSTPNEQGPTATVQPTFTAIVIIREVTVTSPGPSLTPSPSCTVLQDLNLRSGPGTAYRPPINALRANSVVIPLGFAPVGIPGGSWAYIQDSATKEKGWVSAGSDFISCNVKLSALPAVAFGTPKPFFPSTSQASPGTGNGFCVDPDSGIECVGIFSDDSLFQFQIIKNGKELDENDGIGPVSFTITRDGDLVYSTVENNAPYCIFGDNGTCNSWVFEDGINKWTQGGAPVEPGKYKVGIDVNLNGDDSHWEAEFNVKLP
jgi:hypothetical protein